MSSDFDVDLSAAALGRIVMRIRTKPGEMAATPDVKALERRLATAMRRWEDDLQAALLERYGEARANELYRIYENAFPASYREEYTVHEALADIEMLETFDPATDLGMNLHVRPDAQPGRLNFKIYRRGSGVALSDSVPMLERLGVRVQYEHPHEVTPAGAPATRVVDYGLVLPAGAEPDLAKVRDAFHQAFFGMWSGTLEADNLNRLVRSCRAIGARDRDPARLRALSAPGHLDASASPTWSRRSPGTRASPACWCACSSRASPERVTRRSLAAQIAAALDEVENLDEDRILRSFLAVVQATTRTNYFLNKPYLSFKLDPKRVPGLPEPRPMFEIWVYSPRFEGVHLRGGRVARGGLRWSDRMEDFRTEVLGLMKAQMVKNVVIVPVGAKGGFVLKRAPPATARRSRKKASPAIRISCAGCSTSPTTWSTQAVVPPKGVVRHDGDDPYLVVAADKGTATFSDYANAIAARVPLLARRRVRLRRLGGLRPQEDGDHGARRLGIGEAPFPRARRRHADDRLHRRRHRRHVGRRVRQRHAAFAPHPARRRVRPSPRLPRSVPRRGASFRERRSGFSVCRARRGRTTTRSSSPRAAACIRAPPSRSPSPPRRPACSGSKRKPWRRTS